MPYSVCGCVPDPDHESRIGRLASKISHLAIRKDKSPAPGAPPANPRPDLVCVKEEEADSSHPSEHNINFGDPKSVETLKQKEAREQRAMECVASAKKAAAWDPWRGLQVARNEKRRDENHREAFTDPYWYGYYYPYWGVSAAIPIGYVSARPRIFFGGWANESLSDTMVGIVSEVLVVVVRDAARLDVADLVEAAVLLAVGRAPVVDVAAVDVVVGVVVGVVVDVVVESV